MKTLSESIKSLPVNQFIEWLRLACLDVREVRFEEDAQDEINKILEAVTERLDALEARVKELEAELERLKAQEQQPDRQKLRDLVDVVWSDAAESPNFLPTEWADRLIAQVFSSTAAAVPVKVAELSMQIRRLVRALKNSNPEHSLVKSVPDYMQRNGYWNVTDALRGDDDGAEVKS